MANRRFTQFFNTLHTRPVLIDCNFVVDSTNGNGLGIRSLKGPGVQAVYMHTSATPATGNPNPAVGHAIIQLQDNYNRYFGGFSGFVAPVSGSALTSTTANITYVIVSLGTATLAQWQAKGLPAGITPAVGVAFVATASGSIGGSAAVETVLNSGISSIEVIGDPNTTLTSSAATVIGVSSGAYLIVHFLGPKTFSSTATTATDTTLTAISSTAGLRVGQAVFGAGIPLGTTIATIVSATAITLSAATTASASGVAVSFPDSYGVVQPTDGSVCGMSFYLSNSRITVQGE